MSNFLIKLKTKSGETVLKDLSKEHIISDLLAELTKICEIPKASLKILSGFPPKPLDITNETCKLSDAGITSGDTLIIEEKKLSPEEIEANNKKEEEDSNSLYLNQLTCPGILMRKVVPADNSCLFTSVGFTLSGKVDTTSGSYMRQLIAEHVALDQTTYSEAILGKPNKEYCTWILNSESWGGGIEISVLSRYYGVEIAVVDTINGIINRFGEDQDYAQRVFLIFDGIHYDPLYLEPMEGGDVQTIFPITDNRVLCEAEQLAREAKSARQFTDVNKFSVKCLICQILLTGQVEAQKHAKETGHASFGEV